MAGKSNKPSLAQLQELRDHVRVALLVAIPGGAPQQVTEALAVAAGMLEAATKIDGSGFFELIAKRARGALKRYRAWRTRSRVRIARTD